MPPEPDTLTVSYTATFDDALRLQRYIASGNRRSSAYWSVARLCSIALSSLQFVFPTVVFGMTTTIVPGHGWADLARYKVMAPVAIWAAAGFLFVVLDIFGDRIKCSAAVGQSPWILSAISLTIGSEIITVKSPEREAAFRIPYFTRIELDRGDLYLFTEAASAFSIPHRAFGDIDRSLSVYEALTATRSIASSSGANEAVAGCQGPGIWPPTPQRGNARQPFPALGSAEFEPTFRLAYTLAETDYLAVQTRETIAFGCLAVVTGLVAIAALARGGTITATFAGVAFAAVLLIVIVAALNRDNPAVFKLTVTGRVVRIQEETLTTDFVELRVDSPDASLCYRVGSLSKVADYPNHVVVYAASKVSHIVPKSAFGTPEAATEFVRRLRAAIKAERPRLLADTSHFTSSPQTRT